RGPEAGAERYPLAESHVEAQLGCYDRAVADAGAAVVGPAVADARSERGVRGQCARIIQSAIQVVVIPACRGTVGGSRSGEVRTDLVAFAGSGRQTDVRQHRLC